MSKLTTGHVFMSYSRKDEAVMRRIVVFLRQQGIKIWVDNEKLIPGTPIWEEEIEKAIKSAFAIVAVLSPDSKNSEWVRREISLADQYRKRVFPVMVRGNEESSISLRLIGRQYVDICKDEDAGLGSLETALSEYLQELRTQEQKAKTDAQKLARGKVIQEVVDKPKFGIKEEVRKRKVRRNANEKTLNEKEQLSATHTAKNELAKQGFVNSVSFVNQIKQKLIASPKNMIIGFGGILIVTLLVVWGTAFRASQMSKDALGFTNTTAADTPTFQQTMEATASILEEAANTPPSITSTNISLYKGERVLGVNVSKWESVDQEIDWPKVKNAGIDFVFIKATEGDSYTDPTFDSN